MNPEDLAMIDLWSGTGSASDVWFRMGFHVVTVDNDPAFHPTICKDILDVTVTELREAIGGRPLVFVWASPDCRVFSVANYHSKHFHPSSREPMTPDADMAVERCLHTLELIRALDPPHWIIENPVGLMRKMHWIQWLPRFTVTYCQYGDSRMKPTDLFGYPPRSWWPKRCENGDTCHEPSPRGSNSGTQALSRVDRAKIPYALTMELHDAILTGEGERHITLLDFA